MPVDACCDHAHFACRLSLPSGRFSKRLLSTGLDEFPVRRRFRDPTRVVIPHCATVARPKPTHRLLPHASCIRPLRWNNSARPEPSSRFAPATPSIRPARARYRKSLLPLLCSTAYKRLQPLCSYVVTRDTPRGACRTRQLPPND